MIESLLLAVTRVSTFLGNQPLTGATGFFFERDNRLFLVTSRHVVSDEASNHRPDRLEIELHVDGIGIEREHAERAVQLSFERYCSVAGSFAPDIVLETRLILNGEQGSVVRQSIWTAG